MLIFRNSYEGMHAVVQFLVERGIPFYIEKRSQNSNYIYDIFLPEGLKNATRPLGGKYVSLDLKGPTGVEIKGRLLLIPYQDMETYIQSFTSIMKFRLFSLFI